MNNAPRGNGFLSGFTVLTVSTVLVKIIGLVYKIPLMHYLGAEGMGYFNAAYELYSFFFVVATSGLPIAISILISESAAVKRDSNVKRVFRIALITLAVIGSLGSLLLFLFSHRFSSWIGSPAAQSAIAVIAPTVLFASVSSAMRGYFQGKQNMVPTAISQVIEAFGKLILGVVLAAFAARQGWPPQKMAAITVVGLVAGSAISMLYLTLSQMASARREQALPSIAVTDSSSRVLRRLFWLAVPVTVSASLSGLTRVVDMSLILRRMTDIGYTSAEATAMFGSYSTLAVPIYHLPSSLIAGIAISLVPSLAEMIERGDQGRITALITDAVRICAVIAIPCSLGIAVFSHPILSLLFSDQAQAIEVAAPLLTLLGFSVLSSCLITVTGAVLQANKSVVPPVLSMLFGIGIKVVFAYLLMGIPSVGMAGAPISTLLSNLFVVGMNLYYMEKQGLAAKNLFAVLMRPLFASSAAVGVGVLVFFLLLAETSERSAFLVGVMCCAAVYPVVAVHLRAVEEKDLYFLPPKIQKYFNVKNKTKI